ncbi:MAG: hypothetical protein AAF481_06985 [Acidobacteriota bacterium]
MKKALWIVVLVALIVGFAPATMAEEIKAPPPVVETADTETLVPQDDTVEALSIEELLGISVMGEAQEKFMCWPETNCTTDRDCEITGQPAGCPVGYSPTCENPSGNACAGTCVCC